MIQNIADNAAKARFYFSDANHSYQSVSYFGKHFYFHNKSHTFTIEGVISEIRKYIAALQRRSKCFFRSLETFNVVMSVFVHAYNKFGQFKFDFPHLWFLDLSNAWSIVNGESNLDSFMMGFRLGANFAYDAFISTETPFEDLLNES